MTRRPPPGSSRRAFLWRSGALVASAAFASPGRAIGPASEVTVAHLQHGAAPDPRPEALRRLLWETGRRTSINVGRDARALRVEDPALFDEPLLVLAGDGALPAFHARERALLQKHLRMGGLLWVDAPGPAHAFAADAERELRALFPREGLTPLPSDHVLFKSFYLLDAAAGRTDDETRVDAVLLQDRLAVVFTRCDVLGALERDRLGTWRYECEPGGERQREKALRFGVNLVMYATCLDYKADQVHIPFIMKKKRR